MAAQAAPDKQHLVDDVLPGDGRHRDHDPSAEGDAHDGRLPHGDGALPAGRLHAPAVPGADLLRAGDHGGALRLRPPDSVVRGGLLDRVRRGLCDADVYRQPGVCESNWPSIGEMEWSRR